MYGGDKEIVSVCSAENGYVVKTAKTDAEIKAAQSKNKTKGDAPMCGSYSDPDMTVHETAKSAMEAVNRAFKKHAGESADEAYTDGFKDAAKEHAGNKG